MEIERISEKWMAGEKQSWIKKGYPGIIRESRYNTHSLNFISFDFFRNEGFLATRKGRIEKGTMNQILYFYIACINFTNKSQDIENEVNYLLGDKNFDIDKNECKQMIQEYQLELDKIRKKYTKRICESYKELVNFLK